MKHHAFMLWSLLIFHPMFWPVQAIISVYNRHHGIFLSTILVVKPRNHLQILIKSKRAGWFTILPDDKTHDVRTNQRRQKGNTFSRT